MIMANKDWSKEWDNRNKRNDPIRRDWKHFISGFIVGGFTIFAVMFAFDMILRVMFG